MVQRLLFFVLTILVVKRISSLPLRLLVAAPFVLLTAADMSISLYSWCTFGTTFNDGFAISVLQSDPDEVVKMLGMYIPYLCAFAFLSLLFLAVIIKYDVSLPTKKVTGILLLIVISGSLFSACQFAYKDAKNKKAICYLYTVFQSQLFCFSSERASKITLNCKHGAVFSIISQGYRY